MSDPFISREKLLEEFGLMTEEEVARLFGIKVKSLRDRSRKDQPEFSKVGGRRLYKREAVERFIKQRISR